STIHAFRIKFYCINDDRHIIIDELQAETSLNHETIQ
ncbi:unnamed protein product, partial [Rotaria sp. Silwood2]